MGGSTTPEEKKAGTFAGVIAFAAAAVALVSGLTGAGLLGGLAFGILTLFAGAVAGALASGEGFSGLMNWSNKAVHGGLNMLSETLTGTSVPTTEQMIAPADSTSLGTAVAGTTTSLFAVGGGVRYVVTAIQDKKIAAAAEILNNANGKVIESADDIKVLRNALENSGKRLEAKKFPIVGSKVHGELAHDIREAIKTHEEWARQQAIARTQAASATNVADEVTGSSKTPVAAAEPAPVAKTAPVTDAVGSTKVEVGGHQPISSIDTSSAAGHTHGTVSTSPVNDAPPKISNPPSTSPTSPEAAPIHPEPLVATADAHVPKNRIGGVESPQPNSRIPSGLPSTDYTESLGIRGGDGVVSPNPHKPPAAGVEVTGNVNTEMTPAVSAESHVSSGSRVASSLGAGLNTGFAISRALDPNAPVSERALYSADATASAMSVAEDGLSLFGKSSPILKAGAKYAGPLAVGVPAYTATQAYKRGDLNTAMADGTMATTSGMMLAPTAATLSGAGATGVAAAGGLATIGMAASVVVIPAAIAAPYVDEALRTNKETLQKESAFYTAGVTSSAERASKADSTALMPKTEDYRNIRRVKEIAYNLGISLEGETPVAIQKAIHGSLEKLEAEKQAAISVFSDRYAVTGLKGQTDRSLVQTPEGRQRLNSHAEQLITAPWHLEKVGKWLNPSRFKEKEEQRASLLRKVAKVDHIMSQISILQSASDELIGNGTNGLISETKEKSYNLRFVEAKLAQNSTMQSALSQHSNSNNGSSTLMPPQIPSSQQSVATER